MLSQISHICANAGPLEFLQAIENCISTILNERRHGIITGGNVTDALVEIIYYDNLVIISDLHGDSDLLYQLLEKVHYDKFLSQARNKMVFLGDYVDRGSDSIGVLHTICYLKNEYPQSVVLMRGNHEAPLEFPFASHDLPYQLEHRFGIKAQTIYGRVLALFRLLTLGTVIRGRLLLVHGGLPTEDPLDWKQMISTAQESHTRNRVMEELLWNDPRDLKNDDWEPSWRGIGRHFGSSVTEKWIAATATKVVVRGHEPCQGYRIDHNNRILTLFSCRHPHLNSTAAAYIAAGKEHIDLINGADDLAKFVRRLI
jgi:diadenosine tetraphosphatase ApaH/serine/threonine PP2A family protein phosphatase